MTAICISRRDEEVVRQAIQIRDRCRIVFQCHNSAFGTAADRARDMELGRGDRSAGDDEVRERLKLGLHRIDRALQLFDAPWLDAGKPIITRRREMRADVEQIGLDGIQLFVDG